MAAGLIFFANSPLEERVSDLLAGEEWVEVFLLSRVLLAADVLGLDPRREATAADLGRRAVEDIDERIEDRAFEEDGRKPWESCDKLECVGVVYALVFLVLVLDRALDRAVEL